MESMELQQKEADRQQEKEKGSWLTSAASAAVVASTTVWHRKCRPPAAPPRCWSVGSKLYGAHCYLTRLFRSPTGRVTCGFQCRCCSSDGLQDSLGSGWVYRPNPFRMKLCPTCRLLSLSLSLLGCVWVQVLKKFWVSVGSANANNSQNGQVRPALDPCTLRPCCVNRLY